MSVSRRSLRQSCALVFDADLQPMQSQPAAQIENQQRRGDFAVDDLADISLQPIEQDVQRPINILVPDAVIDRWLELGRVLLSHQGVELAAQLLQLPASPAQAVQDVRAPLEFIQDVSRPDRTGSIEPHAAQNLSFMTRPPSAGEG
jgi:hypothetical protein